MTSRTPAYLMQHKEEQDVQEGKVHQFKARPLDRRIVDGHGLYGVPKVTLPHTCKRLYKHMHTKEQG